MKEASRTLQYEQTHMQSDLYKNLDEREHEWLRCNIDPKKASAIIRTEACTLIQAGVGYAGSV